MKAPATKTRTHAATQNACRLCTPLGACLAFKGLERTVPLLHGSQGCATYIRRYMISHFREPVDIASSSFSEATAVFGGERNLHAAITNVLRQYDPAVIGIATTCLSETIGDDVALFLSQYRRDHAGSALPPLVHVSTPSYSGSHVEGYRDTLAAIVKTLSVRSPAGGQVNILPSIVSPEDLRFLKHAAAALGVPAVVLPDYSDTLDGPFWPEYRVLPEGGTPLASVRTMAGSAASIELGYTLGRGDSPGAYLREAFGVPHVTLDLPVGVAATDRFLHTLGAYGATPLPDHLARQRGRLLDSYADAHKYLFGHRVAIYGEPDLVVAMTAFVSELGMVPVLCATGSARQALADRLRAVIPALPETCTILEDADFSDIDAAANGCVPDMLIGHSKGFKTARRLGVPLVRVGFPVHDRFGAQRLRLLGYDGAMALLDRIVNTILDGRQAAGTVGYTYF